MLLNALCFLFFENLLFLGPYLYEFRWWNFSSKHTDFGEILFCSPEWQTLVKKEKKEKEKKKKGGCRPYFWKPVQHIPQKKKNWVPPPRGIHPSIQGVRRERMHLVGLLGKNSQISLFLVNFDLIPLFSTGPVAPQ